MGSWHSRFWVCLALLSLLMELAQGPKPIGAWWAVASVATEQHHDHGGDEPGDPPSAALRWRRRWRHEGTERHQRRRHTGCGRDVRRRQQWILSQMRMWGGKIDYEDPNTPKKPGK